MNDEQIPVNLKENSSWKFSKKEIREYPLETNIFLVDEKWSPKAYIEIVSLKKDVILGYTSGEFLVKRMFNEDEEIFLGKILSEMYLKENN